MTSHGSLLERKGWILRVETEEGMIGHGEAADSLPGFGITDIGGAESDRTVLSRLINSLRDAEFNIDKIEVLKFVNNFSSALSPALRFGFETAVCDLAARINGIPLSEWITPDSSVAVPVNYLVPSFVNDWDRVKADITASRYLALKIKVGAGSIADDITAVRQLRSMFDYHIAIRLDANQAWDYDTALAVLDVLGEYDIDYVEEPLKVFDPDLLVRLRNETGIKIALDESLPRIKDLAKILARKACDVLILKPAIWGGLFAGLEKKHMARAHDRVSVVTSNLETEIGIAALLHLAAALPGEHIPCGLDTLRFFENGDAALMKVSDGYIEVPPGGGIGEGIGEAIWDSL